MGGVIEEMVDALCYHVPMLVSVLFTPRIDALHHRRNRNIGSLGGHEVAYTPRSGRQLHRERRWVMGESFSWDEMGVGLLEATEWIRARKSMNFRPLVVVEESCRGLLS